MQGSKGIKVYYFNGYYNYLILVLLVELKRCLYVVKMLRPAPVSSTTDVVKSSYFNMYDYI